MVGLACSVAGLLCCVMPRLYQGESGVSRGKVRVVGVDGLSLCDNRLHLEGLSNNIKMCFFVVIYHYDHSVLFDIIVVVVAVLLAYFLLLR